MSIRLTEHPAGGPGQEASRPAADFLAARSLKRQLLEELKSGWEEGRPVPAEEVLPRWPTDPAADPDAASVLFEEYCQRRQQAEAERPRPEEYEERFPSLKDSLASLLRRHEILCSVAGVSGSSTTLGLALPAVGDEVFGFRLRQELGRGAFARVFLAEQENLAGRPVVVKISAVEGDEPQTLAQLQHTHIVPIYSVHEDARAGVRAVCMPYFGGASLSRVLEAVYKETDRPARGQEFVRVLAEVAGPAVPGKEEPQSPQLARLAGLSYLRAAVLVVAKLAEGLQHAHDRGVLHCDIKPSNVLLGADGQPMLLDFNLAQQLAGDRSQVQATLGGTVAYMAPEHLRALATRDPALARRVDPRADVYALGMVLFEMLTGRRPFDQSASYSPVPALIEAMALERSRAVPSLRAHRPDAPWGLESIVRKCLAPDPADRYQRADQLAEDLHRLLEDRPLRHTPELSWKERAGKWVRRHPRLATAGLLSAAAGVLALIGLSIFLGIHARLEAAEADREKQARALQTARGAQARQRRQEFEAGATRALCLLNTTANGHDHAEQGLKTCERTLALYGVLDGNDWHDHPDWQFLSAEEQRQAAESVRELLLLLARGRVDVAQRRARHLEWAAFPSALAGLSASGPLQILASETAGRLTGDSRWEEASRVRTKALRSALALLDRAEAIPGLAPSPALWEERASFREQLGDKEGAARARNRARDLPPVSARDHYLLATNHAARGRFGAAVVELREALRKNPRHYWSWFQRGICYQELGEPALALSDFSACVVLWPEFAWGYFNRGRLLHQLGKTAEALEDYSAALRRDPGLSYARLNRGLVYLDLGKHAEALADFEAAAGPGKKDTGTSDSLPLPASSLVVAHAGRGIALEHLGRHAEADEAFRLAWECDPDHVPMLLGYGFAVARRLPERAREAFTRVLLKEPRNPRALYGQGMLYSDQAADSEQALFFFERALEADPTFVAARRARALVLAHRGQGALARRDIDWCVAADPAGVTLYAAACVYALSAEKAADPAEARWTADRAVVLLREALALGYGKDRAEGDADLRSIRRRPEFMKLLGTRE